MVYLVMMVPKILTNIQILKTYFINALLLSIKVFIPQLLVEVAQWFIWLINVSV